MRTIKRFSLPINTGKFEKLRNIANVYSQEKDKWLTTLSYQDRLPSLRSYYDTRNELVKSGYKSDHLQARMWKLALKDAFETLDRNWKALFVLIRPFIQQNSNLNDNQKHYCYWLLKDYERLGCLFIRNYPKPDFKISRDEVIKSGNYLNRTIRKYRGKTPRVKKARSFCLDGEMYKVFTKRGKQYIQIMTLDKRKRLAIPLTGKGKIRGNIRIILNKASRIIEVHYATDIKPRWNAFPDIEAAIDFGVTEVFTDEYGDRYGQDFGKALYEYSDKLDAKAKARNKLYSIANKALENGNTKKARNIRKYNLGYKKKNSFSFACHSDLENIINKSFNEFFSYTHPCVFITENLRHTFSFNKGKRLNRRLSIWTKGIIQDRAEFKAQEGRSLHKQVNPAYGSQTCPMCDFVWSRNRNGDKFKCLFCGYEAKSDRVAAMNYLTRSKDSLIGLYVPYKQVKTILVDRFLRRVECWDYDFTPDNVNWTIVPYLCKDWEALRDKAVKVYLQRTAPGRTLGTSKLSFPD